jgi:hypothetical protein
MAAGSYLEIKDTLWTLGDAAESHIARFPLDEGASSLVDRSGEGPGEFRFVNLAGVHPAGDTVVVISDRRIIFFTLELQEIRSGPAFVRFPKGMLVLADGSILITSPRATKPAQAAGFVLHEVNPTGQYVRSLRATDSTYAVGSWPIAHGHEESTIWLVEPRETGFIAEQWNTTKGERVRELRVDPEWWEAESKTPQYYEQAAQRRESMPKLPSSPTDVRDSGTHLWVALYHFDPDHAQDTFVGYEPHDMFDGVLLALDRVSGDVLASVVFDEALFGFTNRGRIVLYDVDDSGNPRLKLAEVTLTGR